MVWRRANPLLLFGLIALAVNLALAWLLRHDHRPIVTAAACADFLVSLPAIYYLLAIRIGAQPISTLVPVIIGGLLRVAYLLPLSGVGRIAAAGVCECGLAWFLFRRGGHSLAARILWSELTVLRYALAGWALQPEVPPGGRTFSLHRHGGAAFLFGLIAALSLVEAACAHLAVHRWSPTLAWVLSALSLYGALLLIALARAYHLRPIVLTQDSLLIRAGLLWSVRIAPGNIARVATVSSQPGWLKITGMAEPNVFLELYSDVTAEGFYGRRRTTRQIAISADQPRELLEAIKLNCPPRTGTHCSAC